MPESVKPFCPVCNLFLDFPSYFDDEEKEKCPYCTKELLNRSPTEIWVESTVDGEEGGPFWVHCDGFAVSLLCLGKFPLDEFLFECEELEDAHKFCDGITGYVLRQCDYALARAEAAERERDNAMEVVRAAMELKSLLWKTHEARIPVRNFDIALAALPADLMAELEGGDDG